MPRKEASGAASEDEVVAVAVMTATECESGVGDEDEDAYRQLARGLVELVEPAEVLVRTTLHASDAIPCQFCPVIIAHTTYYCSSATGRMHCKTGQPLNDAPSYAACYPCVLDPEDIKPCEIVEGKSSRESLHCVRRRNLKKLGSRESSTAKVTSAIDYTSIPGFIFTSHLVCA
ncbi:hypothetical protein FH972_025530 [Carpinus fangiana]|uniref:Uncharacterized protein n=1 Tax=Carpinus fangiana TaxID=176857 RepID=A0A5N6L1A6_9ROSI|nr:hypothetical protein FH972_025530 [Carpinus fangiana]